MSSREFAEWMALYRIEAAEREEVNRASSRDQQ